MYHDYIGRRWYNYLSERFLNIMSFNTALLEKANNGQAWGRTKLRILFSYSEKGKEEEKN